MYQKAQWHCEGTACGISYINAPGYVREKYLLLLENSWLI